MQSIIISGASGFLGSSLVKAFLDNGYNVSALVRMTSNLDRLESILNNPNFKLYRLNEDANINSNRLESILNNPNFKLYSLNQDADINSNRLESILNNPNFKLYRLNQDVNINSDINWDNLNSEINWDNIDVAIHTATNYGRNNQDAHSVFMANEDFALRFLEACSNHKVKAFINTDSFFNTEDIIYDNLLYYATSKKNFMAWGRAFANKGLIKFINVKLFHLYGFGDSKDKFVDYIISSLLSNVSEINLTKGEQQRDFISITDVTNAYIFIAIHLAKFTNNFTNFDLGSGTTISIKALTEKLKQLTQNTVTQLNFGALNYHHNEIMHSQADITFLKEIGWQPLISLDKGLIQYIKQYKTVNNV